MKAEIKKWIWQHDDYPNFVYDKTKLTELLASVDYYRGRLDAITKLFNQTELEKIEVDSLTDELINTALIEGEFFKRDSVRSSFRKKLDKNFDAQNDKYSTAQTDSLVQILIDSNTNKNKLNITRLHGWHNCLFENSYSKLSPINVAAFRKGDNMQVVSGAIGHEKIHYKAIPVKNIESDIKKLLNYCSKSDENIYIKSAVAHLWFVIIHPYDDGNGRIARAITDFILSQNNMETQFKLYSLSTAINSDRKGYYSILDKTTNLSTNKTLDITAWLLWHLNILKNAMHNALKNIDYLIQKTKFWENHRNKNLNQRQIKVLNKMLDAGAENFAGGLTTKKYIAMTKVSKATAVRDITALVEFGCIKQVESSKGRNVNYELLV